jgi:hypothetical protein
MAGPTIDQAFITQFNKDLHLTYRQMGSKLRGLVRTDGQVVGSSVNFYKLGTLAAGTKARNGDIPVQNPDHSKVTANMADYYIHMLADQLDLTKLEVDVRKGYVEAGASAFGIKTDEIIIKAMSDGATVNYGGYSGNLTRNNALLGVQKLNEKFVPDDGKRFALVTASAWSHLMAIDQFVRADYVGPDLPFKQMGIEARTWLGVHWMCSQYLPGAGTNQAKYYLFHSSAVGHGINADVSTQWQWKNEKWAWSMAGAMSMGAVVIDTNGIVEMRFDDTAALAA